MDPLIDIIHRPSVGSAPAASVAFSAAHRAGLTSPPVQSWTSSQEKEGKEDTPQ